MNIEKSKTIAIQDILAKMNFSPSHTKGNDLWYKSPFSKNERTPSFKVNNNRWYCHSSGFGGYALDLILKLNNCTVSEALNYLESNSFSFQKQIFEPPTEQEKSYRIEKIIPIQHLALIQYLKSRGITKYQNEDNLKEIRYSMNNVNYFALGFRNNSQGYEIRSKYTKICLGNKDVTLIINNCETLKVYEGFIDYLSNRQNDDSKKMSDYLILNSVALLNKNISILKNYKTIFLYLDNDIAGETHTNFVLENFTNAFDMRSNYKNFKDYNEWFMNFNSQIIETQKAVVRYKRR